MILYGLVLLTGVFISACSQVILKKAASKEYDNVLKEYLNFPVIASYGIFFLATLLSVLAYKKLPLSIGVVLDTSSYVFVTVLGVLIFKEKMNAKKAIALCMIISGILCCSLLG